MAYQNYNLGQMLMNAGVTLAAIKQQKEQQENQNLANAINMMAGISKMPESMRGNQQVLEGLDNTIQKLSGGKLSLPKMNENSLAAIMQERSASNPTVEGSMTPIGAAQPLPKYAPIQSPMTPVYSMVGGKLTKTGELPQGAQIAKTDSPPQMKPFQTREIKVGDKILTQEYNPQTQRFENIASGPRFNEDAFVVGQTPDGKPYMIKTKGGTLGQTLSGIPQFEKDTSKKIEQGIMDNSETLKDLYTIEKKFNPDYAKYEGTIKGGWLGLKDKMGMELSDQEKEYLGGFTQYRAEAGQALANKLRAMSGTAVTEPEMKRQYTYMINPGTGIFDGDSPTQVKAKITRMREFTEKALARLAYFRMNGLSIKGSEDLQKAINSTGLSIDKVNPKDIMTKRALQLRQMGMSPEDATKTISNEFGIPQ